MDMKSPFRISEDDLRMLEQNDRFKGVRTQLFNQGTNGFCSCHSSLSHPNQQAFILHRDILHSLLRPLLQIRSQAALFAARSLSRQSRVGNAWSPVSPRSVVDLELAFRGAGRGAFSWLQCFVTEERDWCSTKGCPTCVVLKVLHSEPFLRMVVAACRLSSDLKDIMQHNRQHDGIRTFIIASVLPEFGFWLSAVHQAVSEDEFWGLHFWEDIEARAEGLELGVEDLIRQCCEISSSPSPTAQVHPRRIVTFGDMPCVRHQQPAEGGTLIKRQPKSEEEGQEWMKRIIEACWLALVQEDCKRRKMGAFMRLRPGGMRTRSLTT